MPDHPPEQVDRVAQAMATAGGGDDYWQHISERTRDIYRRMACAALDAATPATESALRSAGQTKQFGPRPRIATTPPVGSVGERDQ